VGSLIEDLTEPGRSLKRRSVQRKLCACVCLWCRAGSMWSRTVHEPRASVTAALAVTPLSHSTYLLSARDVDNTQLLNIPATDAPPLMSVTVLCLSLCLYVGPIANLKGHYFQPSLSVSLSVCLFVCVCVSDRHFYPSTLTDFHETWSQGPYSDLVWPRP